MALSSETPVVTFQDLNNHVGKTVVVNRVVRDLTSGNFMPMQVPKDCFNPTETVAARVKGILQSDGNGGFTVDGVYRIEPDANNFGARAVAVLE